MLWLANFPLPPSVNEYLMPVSGGWSVSKKGRAYQKGRWVKTKEHTDYMKRCELWALANKRGFTDAKEKLKEEVRKATLEKKRIAFRVDTYFAFENSRIWTVNNLPQQLDADNRLKPCRDALAKILEIDDKYFFSGFFEKVTTTNKNEECTILRIETMYPRTLEDIKKVIKSELEA